MNKIAIITGGERGLGYELATKYISEGYTVYSLDLLKANTQKNKKYIKTDITNEKQVIRALKKIDKIDLLINNAGIMRRGTTFDSDEDDFDKLFAVNVKGAWLVTKYALPNLTKEASVVMISSRHSSLPENPGLYGLTKKTLEHIGELLEKEPQAKNKAIKVKTAILGPFESELSKIGYSKKKYAQRKNMMNIDEVANKLYKFIKSKKKKLKLIPN